MWNREKQSLLQESRRALRRAENKIEELSEENIVVHKENKDLRFENEELRDIINKAYNLSTSNKYNNEKAILAKIKEVITDAQIKQ